jgi:hypothetical protein
LLDPSAVGVDRPGDFPAVGVGDDLGKVLAQQGFTAGDDEGGAVYLDQLVDDQGAGFVGGQLGVLLAPGVRVAVRASEVSRISLIYR